MRMREDVYGIGFRTRRKFSTGTHHYAHHYRSTFIFIFMFVLFTLLIYTYIQLLHDALEVGDGGLDKWPSFAATLVLSISISLEVIADYLHLVPAVTDTKTTKSAV